MDNAACVSLAGILTSSDALQSKLYPPGHAQVCDQPVLRRNSAVGCFPPLKGRWAVVTGLHEARL